MLISTTYNLCRYYIYILYVRHQGLSLKKGLQGCLEFLRRERLHGIQNKGGTVFFFFFAKTCIQRVWGSTTRRTRFSMNLIVESRCPVSSPHYSNLANRGGGGVACDPLLSSELLGVFLSSQPKSFDSSIPSHASRRS